MMASNQSFASPTESEFSDIDGPESAKKWDEEQVCDWLRSNNCGEYEKLFRKNNINGENLLEMDKAVLQEMGIDKIGDRVRLFLGIKKLRTRAYANQKKRNRVSASRSVIFPLSLTFNRIPSLVSMPTHPHHLGHLDLPTPAVVPCLILIRDTRGNSTALTPLLPFQRTSANLLRGPIHPSLDQK
jgi:mitogen-activated protein kinase kinase kinase